MNHPESQPVLAQYDFRTKQKYIYRTNKIKEIVGASGLITSAYDRFIKRLSGEGIWIEKNYSFPDREELKDPSFRYREYMYTNDVNTPFDPKFTDEIDGKVLCVGGGNLYMLWRNRETALRANRILCRMLREETYSLSPAIGMTEYTGNYKEDMGRVHEAFEDSKNTIPPFMPMAVLPVTRVDSLTSFPIAWHGKDGVQEVYLSAESKLKRDMAGFSMQPSKNDPLGETMLDSMAEKGEDSILAVIYIDGNNMGQRVSDYMNRTDADAVNVYADAVRRIRDFSNHIQNSFVTEPLAEIEKTLPVNERARLVIAGGDEITLICRAKYAYGIVKTYFEKLEKTDTIDGKKNTACAGICLFHSHSPFSTAYQIAEECCESAKKKSRRSDIQNGLMLMDFQYCFSGVTGDLETIRKMTDGSLLGRPYNMGREISQGIPSHGSLEEMAKTGRKIGRGALKKLSQMLLSGNKAEFDLEARRLSAKYAVDLPTVGSSNDERLRVLFDAAQMFDLWFSEEVS